jgi:hypothetical protein
MAVPVVPQGAEEETPVRMEMPGFALLVRFLAHPTPHKPIAAIPGPVGTPEAVRVLLMLRGAPELTPEGGQALQG